MILMSERTELIDRLQLLSEQDATQTALFQQHAAARYGLGVTDMKALSIMLREGPQTAGALVERLHVTSGAVTGVVDRLSAAGVVRREHDTADRRRVVISVVPEGFVGREDVYAGIGQAFLRLYEGYTLDELRFLADHVARAVEITIEQTAIIAR